MDMPSLRPHPSTRLGNGLWNHIPERVPGACPCEKSGWGGTWRVGERVAAAPVGLVVRPLWEDSGSPGRLAAARRDGQPEIAEGSPSGLMMLPVFLGERVPPETLASTLAELDRCLQLLEDKFLKDDDFLTGPCISVADLVAITELMHPVSAGYHVFKTRPKLAAWRQRVEAAVGEDLFQEAHEVVMKAKDLPPVDTAMKDKLKPLVQVLL
ncbi:glutathione S-transferase theta-3-like isoform X2 [Myotis daubentonii]|uniref:glutathione S-transferase theta-3-like isoform X2 n=1 Tax=Myotis daubentonii TaxID=98922 RepID=UPI0028731795|nr:glutathione S-transferase theta-3-like isoform X2 [Myotis daubentonii]